MLNFNDAFMDSLMAPYYNGSYKENKAAYLKEVYTVYTNVLSNRSLVNFIRNYMSLNISTTITRLFIKDLLEVILADKKKDFNSYALVIDNETPNPFTKFDIKIEVNKLTNVVKNNADEFSKILSIVGLESTIAIVYVLKKLK